MSRQTSPTLREDEGSDETHADEREAERLDYPPAHRPHFVPDAPDGVAARTRQREHDVVVCAEDRLRYELGAAPVPRVGTPLEGVVHLLSGARVRVAGIVVRVRAGEVELALTRRGLSARDIAAERRSLERIGSGLGVERHGLVSPSGAPADPPSPQVATSTDPDWAVLRHDPQGTSLVGRFRHERLARMIAESDAQRRQLPGPLWQRYGRRWIGWAGPLVRYEVRTGETPS